MRVHINWLSESGLGSSEYQVSNVQMIQVGGPGLGDLVGEPTGSLRALPLSGPLSSRMLPIKREEVSKRHGATKAEFGFMLL